MQCRVKRRFGLAKDGHRDGDNDDGSDDLEMGRTTTLLSRTVCATKSSALASGDLEREEPMGIVRDGTVEAAATEMLSVQL